MRFRHTLLWIGLGLALGGPSAWAAAAANPAANPAPDPEPLRPGSVDEALQQVEAVEVTARGTAADVPVALATQIIGWQDAVAAPVDFQDLIVRAPGVGATGQNGLFETFSIRGSGANGILILVGGMPVTAQRRAGVPVAFVEPSLLGEINLTRGPATVHFGPGALGGAVSIEPRWFEGSTAMAGYASAGDEYSLMAGTGNERFSIGIAWDRASDSESANGTPLDTSYRRQSATLQYRGQLGDYSLDALLMPSRSADIGKSNSRFPARNTTYPEDDHTLGRLRLSHDNGFAANLHFHDQSLLTFNQRPGSADTFAFIESLDTGLTVQQTLQRGDFSHNFGFEYLGRRDVNAFDARGTLANRSFSLRDASEDNYSLFAISDWQVSSALSLEAGLRYSHQRQDQAGADADDDDHAISLGAVWQPNERDRFSLSVASGYRFATLEERYFSGVTAQGEIAGNPDLGTEQSLGVDLGYAWRAERWRGEIHLWRTRVDDLIQLFELGPELNGYTNIGEATLHGIDAAIGYNPVDALFLQAGFTLVRSKDELSGDPLYGSPPRTVTLEARYDFDQLSIGGFWTHRFAMDRPGFEEVARDAVDVLDLELAYRWNDSWSTQLFVRNALDENYFATADELSALAQERSIGINLVWSGH